MTTTTAPATTGDNKFRRAWRARLTYMREQLAYYSRHRSVLDALSADLTRALPAAELDVSNCLDVRLIGTREDLRRLMHVLRQHDLKPMERPQAGETGYCAYFYLGGEVAADMKVWVSYSSTQCRLVQVGTQTKEVPVYETVCE